MQLSVQGFVTCNYRSKVLLYAILVLLSTGAAPFRPVRRVGAEWWAAVCEGSEWRGVRLELITGRPVAGERSDMCMTGRSEFEA